MKITTFNPMILSKNAEEIIKLFEELGTVWFRDKHFYPVVFKCEIQVRVPQKKPGYGNGVLQGYRFALLNELDQKNP